ncbi:TIGR03086 family metal-binding protein [Streptomyces sp. NPDC050617]|uniref:TIGR03086 family metal-binding protein n=1 Tax=Streptomyces sp. NPDC050617 TaxID=3154628 RepID=UPI00342CE6E5
MADAQHNPLLTRHAEALDLFTERLGAVRPDQWDAPTPCAEWTVRDLVNHLTVEQLWVPSLVREGSSTDARGDAFDGDQLGDDPATTWVRAASAARAAFSEPNALERTVHLSYGDSSAADYCAEMTTDAVVHSWDLARAIGGDERLPGELVSFAARQVAPHAADLSKTGYFAEPVEPPPGSDPQTKLLCLLGRRP